MTTIENDKLINHCHRLCTKYRCIHLNDKNRCNFNRRKCNVFLTNNGTECRWKHDNQSCRFYYWCYLDYLKGLNSPGESDLNNITIKKYGRELNK